ncbi:MAG TPA: zf-HC2 domain-containing protein [Thermomicrobiales bacterium]|nr:zf-HC2 domain-containing protein [Thermomicrobiales bacterium]
MTCQQARRLLSDRLDQPLPPAQAEALRAHLAGCADCARYDRALQRGVAGIRALPDVSPSPRVRAAVRERIFAGSRRAGPRGGWLRQGAGVAAAALLVVVVAGLTFALLRGGARLTPRFAQRPAAPTTQAAFGHPGSTAAPPSTPGATQVPSILLAPSGSPPAPQETVSAPRTAAFAPATALVQGATATPAPTRPPAPTATGVTPATAAGVVQAYFDAINRRDYQAAYALLGAALQRQQSAADFAAGYAQTAHDDATILSVDPAGPGRYAVNVHLDARQDDGSVLAFNGTYTVGREGGALRIVDARVVAQPTATPPTPTPPATGAAPACAPGQLAPTIHVQGATGNLAIGVLVENHGATCRADTTVAVTLSGADGRLLAVEGNDLRAPLLGDVPPAGAGIAFFWSNWCGQRGPYTIAATAAGQRATATQTIAPRCDDPAAPSRLFRP